mgnify:CR=1 FL=1|jgi:hypothetical protein
MALINQTSRLEDTILVFDDLYKSDIDISSEEYDIVYSFFKKAMGTVIIAQTFALYIFQIARATQTSALDLVATLNNQDKIAITAMMAYYVNNIRSKSVLYGVDNIITPNFHAARNVVI